MCWRRAQDQFTRNEQDTDSRAEGELTMKREQKPTVYGIVQQKKETSFLP